MSNTATIARPTVETKHLTLAVLRKVATDEGIKVTTKMTRLNLVDAILKTRWAHRNA